MVLTASSQWNDLISMAGGVNVFADLIGHTTHVDIEAIIDSNPDYLMFDGITFEIGYDDYDSTTNARLISGLLLTGPDSRTHSNKAESDVCYGRRVRWAYDDSRLTNFSEIPPSRIV